MAKSVAGALSDLNVLSPSSARG